MSQTLRSDISTRSSPPLPGLPRKPLTQEQQVHALQRAQTQAEARIKLGLELYKAAEAHTSQHRKLLKELQHERHQLYEQMQQDMAGSFQQYDQWIGRLEENLAGAIERLEQRMESFQADWARMHHQVEAMMQRSELLFEQARLLIAPPDLHSEDQAPQTASDRDPATPSAVVAASPVEQMAPLKADKVVDDADGLADGAASVGQVSSPGVEAAPTASVVAMNASATPLVTAPKLDLSAMLAASRKRREGATTDENDAAARKADPCVQPPVFEDYQQGPDQAAMLREVAKQVNDLSRAAPPVGESVVVDEPGSTSHVDSAADTSATDTDDDRRRGKSSQFFTDIIERLQEAHDDD